VIGHRVAVRENNAVRVDIITARYPLDERRLAVLIVGGHGEVIHGRDKRRTSQGGMPLVARLQVIWPCDFAQLR